MSVLIKGGRIVTAADDYVGDVFVEGETVSLIGKSLDVQADKVDRRERQVRAAGLHRPAHASRDGLRRDGHLRRLHVRDGVGGLRRHDDACRLLHAGARRLVPGGARRLPREDRAREAGDRRRLPHRHHRPPRGRHARGSRAPARRGRDELQALHGLQGRGHGRRRDALQGDAGRGRVGRARDGARRERRRHRRPRQGSGRTGQDGAEVARRHAPADHRGRGDEPRHPACPHRGSPALRRPRLLQGGDRADRPGPRGRLGTRGARRARSTSSSTRRRSTSRTSRAGSTSTRRRRGRRTTRSTSGTRSRPTYSRSSPPTTAPSTGTARRRSARTTSRRSRTAGRGSRTACT